MPVVRNSNGQQSNSTSASSAAPTLAFTSSTTVTAPIDVSGAQPIAGSSTGEGTAAGAEARQPKFVSKLFDPSQQGFKAGFSRLANTVTSGNVNAINNAQGAPTVSKPMWPVTDKTHPNIIGDLRKEIEVLSLRVEWLESSLEKVIGSIPGALKEVVTGTEFQSNGHLNSPPSIALPASSVSPPSTSGLANLAEASAMIEQEFPPSFPAIAKRLFTPTANDNQIPSSFQSLGILDDEDIGDDPSADPGPSASRNNSVSYSSNFGYEIPWNEHDVEELPPFPTVKTLVTAFFSNNGVAYPFLERSEFMAEIENLFRNYPPPTTLPSKVLKDIRISKFRLFMVCSIGITNVERLGMAKRGTSQDFYIRAVRLLDSVLSGGDIRMVQNLLLMALYATMDPRGPGMFDIVGAALRACIGLGLHRKIAASSATTGPAEAGSLQVPSEKLNEKLMEMRRRVWWSAFNLDRLVTFTLGRPASIRDEDIDIEYPLLPNTSSNELLNGIPYMTYCVHIIKLRQISGDILQNVYSPRQQNLPDAEREIIQIRIHSELDHWRTTIPFFAKHSQSSRVETGFNNLTWFNLAYHICLAGLYRPSVLFPTLTKEKFSILKEASASALEMFGKLHVDRRISLNAIHLIQMFTSAINLLYVLCEFDGDPATNAFSEEWRMAAIETVSGVRELVSDFFSDWKGTLQYRKTFEALAEMLITRSAQPIIPHSDTKTDDAVSYNLVDTLSGGNGAAPVPDDITISQAQDFMMDFWQNEGENFQNVDTGINNYDFGMGKQQQQLPDLYDDSLFLLNFDLNSIM